jgi:hypothetical protein
VIPVAELLPHNDAICFEYLADEVMESPFIDVPYFVECVEISECAIPEYQLQLAVTLCNPDILLSDLGVLSLESSLILSIFLFECAIAVALTAHILRLHLHFLLMFLLILLEDSGIILELPLREVKLWEPVFVLFLCGRQPDLK